MARERIDPEVRRERKIRALGVGRPEEMIRQAIDCGSRDVHEIMGILAPEKPKPPRTLAERHALIRAYARGAKIPLNIMFRLCSPDTPWDTVKFEIDCWRLLKPPQTIA